MSKSILLLFFTLPLYFSCKKDSTIENPTNSALPLITNLPATEIHMSSAQLNAEILNDGKTKTITRGFYYSSEKEVSPLPINRSGVLTIAENSNGVGKYSIRANNLKQNTKYYYNSFTFNSSSGEVYGTQLSFTTKSLATSFGINKLLGGTNGDGFNKLLNSNDGNLIAIGSSTSPKSGNKISGNYGKSDGWVVKFDLNGNIIWDKNYGGNSDDFFLDGCLSNDGGYILSGKTVSTTGQDIPQTGSGNFYIVKIDKNGNKVWNSNINIGTNKSYISIIPVEGGYMLISSVLAGDSYFTKIDEGGGIVWTKKLSYSFSGSSGISSTKSKDGNIFLIGPKDNTLKILKVNINTDIIKEYTITTTDIYYFEGLIESLIKENDKGEIIFAIQHGGSKPRQFIYKLDSSGNVVWKFYLGVTIFIQFNDLIQNSSAGQYYLIGNSNENVQQYKTEPNRGGSDVFILAVDDNGGYLFDKTLGGTGDDSLFSAFVLNNEIYFGGYTSSNKSNEIIDNLYGTSDAWLLKTSFSEK